MWAWSLGRWDLGFLSDPGDAESGSESAVGKAGPGLPRPARARGAAGPPRAARGPPRRSPPGLGSTEECLVSLAQVFFGRVGTRHRCGWKGRVSLPLMPFWVHPFSLGRDGPVP